MCANYKTPERIQFEKEIGSRWTPSSTLAEWSKNVFPKAPGIVAGYFDGKPEVRSLTWGMLARSANSRDFLKKYSTFNAKSETIEASRIFSPAWSDGRRCIIPVEFFVEWEGEKGKKTKLFIRRQNAPVTAIAGLYDYTANREAIGSYTMLTAEPNAFMGKIHHRMPVVLAPEDVDAWLDPDLAPEDAKKFLRPFAGELEFLERSA